MREVVAFTPVKAPTTFCFDHLTEGEISTMSKNLLALMNLSGVDTDRATHYNTKEEMEEARIALHKAAFELDRSIYGCMFCLPGITDFAKQKAVTAMLANPWTDKSKALLTPDKEKKLIDYLVWNLPANRMLNLFGDFRNKKINNARTRHAVLPKILSSGNLELWSVKYRRKARRAIEHTWGKTPTGVIKDILAKREWTTKETKGINDFVWKYIGGSLPAERQEVILKCLSFVLGNDQFCGQDYDIGLFKAFIESKEDLSKGAKLPREVLEGIRSTYHPDVKQDVILNLVKDSMTVKQKKLAQKSARKAGVVIEFDPMRHSMVELYIYAFEMGWSDEILRALNIKARRAANALPFKYEKVGIVVDNSFSMSGSEEQKLRPMAIALSCKDMLWNIADTPIVSWSGMSGEFLSEAAQAARDRRLVRPSGDTNLAGAFLEVLEQEPDAVFVISDGYENAPAGRFEEVLHLVRNQAKIDTPVYHLNPVAASESKLGVKQLSKDVSVMAVSNPETIGLTLFISMLESDPKRGIEGIVATALPIFDKKEVTA